MNDSFRSETNLSAIARMHDNTSFALIAATSLETAGAANTAVAILDLSKYKESTLYIQSTNGPAANAGTTGLTVFIDARPASAIAWTNVRTETGIQTTGMSIMKILGSGVAATSGMTHFGDVRITVQNTTDSSGTATVQAWVLARTP